MCSSDQGRLRPLKRDQLKFDLLDIYSKFALEEQVDDFLDGQSIREFMKRAEQVIYEALQQDRKDSRNLLRGHRAENMFEAVVVSIGRIGSIHQLDVGNAWFRQDVQIPDFQVELSSGEIVLIEVKHFHHRSSPDQRFKLGKKSFERLVRYAELVARPLYFAIYFSRWNQWCLIASADFENQGSNKSTSFFEAMKRNHMTLLGDMTVATVPPLKVTLHTDQLSPPLGNEGGSLEAQISSVEIEAGHMTLEDEREQQIALQLAMFGNWAEEERVVLEAGLATEIRYTFRPLESGQQPFSMIGTLSQMASKRFLLNTTSCAGNYLTQIKSMISPETLGDLIPADYEGSELSLWRFHIIPSASDGSDDSPSDFSS